MSRARVCVCGSEAEQRADIAKNKSDRYHGLYVRDRVHCDGAAAAAAPGGQCGSTSRSTADRRSLTPDTATTTQHQ